MSKLEKYLVLLYVIPFSLDFKGVESGGGIIQFLYLCTVLLSASLLIFFLLKQPIKYNIPKKVLNLSKLWWLFLISSLLTMLINKIPFGNYIRVVMPFLLSGISTFLVLLLYSRGRNLKGLFNPILLATVISVLWTPIYALFFLQIPISEMRHQILSPILPFLLGYGLALLVFDRLMSYKVILVFAVCFGIIVLSVTRSNILIFLGLSIFLFVSLPKDSRKLLWSRLVVITILLILFSAILIPLIEFFRPEILSNWTQRLFTNNSDLGFDVTLTTRLAEYSGQMNLLFETPLTTLVGRGLGSVYLWDYEYFNLLSQVISMHILEDSEPWFAGHSVWVYSLYSGGFLFGLLVPFCLIRSTIWSWVCIRNSVLYTKENKIIIIFFSLICVSIFTASFTANPFGVRIIGLLFGMGVVLPVLFKQQLINEKGGST